MRGCRGPARCVLPGDERAAADSPEHRPALKAFEVLADGDRRDAEASAQLSDLHSAVLVEVDEDGLLAVELAERRHPTSSSDIRQWMVRRA